MAKISQDTIDKIKNSADIVDVVGEFVPLQAAGKNMKGLCPFHSEKTPSFFVSKERQIFNCFGCGKKGNAITFIQEYKHLNFVEALQYLADKYRIPLEFDQRQVRQDKSTNLYKANDLAVKFYNLNLLNMDSGKKALNYLFDRGLDIKAIEEFNLGFAPTQGKALFNQLNKDFQPLELINAGLINRGNSDYYDLFRGRIMFPIHDEQGRCLGFSGRVFGENDNPAKYVNTAQTQIFLKSFIIYNLNRALPHIRRNNRVILMEGYMDVIKASIAGVKETVCSMGTQLTIDQALKLKKFTDNVIICFDGDRAGKEATYKAIKLLEEAKLNVSIVMMPDGLDPDEFISNNPNFTEYVDNNTKDQYEFVYQMIVANKDFTKASDIEVAKNKLFDFFKNTSGTIRDIYFNKFASDTLTNIQTITQDYNQTQINNRITKNLRSVAMRKKVDHKQFPKYNKAEIAIINYYFKDVVYRDRIDGISDGIYFSNKENRMFIQTAIELNKTYTSDNFIIAVKASLTDIHRDRLDSILYLEDYTYTETEFESCIRTLEEAKIKDDISYLEEEAAKKQLLGNQLESLKLQQQKLELEKKLIEIKKGSKNGKKANIR